TYNASLTVTTNYGCQSLLELQQIIKVFPRPRAGFNVNSAKVKESNPVFSFYKAWSDDVTYWNWDFGDGSAQDHSTMNPKHSYSAYATDNDFYSFNVLLFVQNQFGCMDTTERRVELSPYFTFFIPN